ncbi:MRPS31 [Acanthosepion pharaonis]|uniref:Small ribosomal subunit protein mS31 n=1 Tax=Acanthosepion pharaonis TaxID=158019 RepID=A0A812EGD0_ACAPH|nr:MRPS31 [Sepia pharaonis]
MAALYAVRHVLTRTDSFLLKPKYCQKIYLLNSSCKLTLGQIACKKKKIDSHSDAPFKNEKAGESPDEDISPDLISAVKDVANSMPGDKVTVQSDLLQKLLAHKKVIKKQKQYPTEDIPQSPNMQEMFSGMKLYREVDEKKQDILTKQKERNRIQALMHQQNLDGKLFSGPSLGIFTKKPVEISKSDEEPSLWDKVDEELLNSLKLPLPSNHFEELINLTNEGKYWTFPIDNEAGWEEEKKIGFHEHVFLEHLIVDFPKKGPIRHFMELVITGLSNNPHLTVQQKKEHVDWFRDYFEKKKELIDEALNR